MRLITYLILLAGFLSSCSSQAQEPAEPALIPVPVHQEVKSGVFKLNGKTAIVINKDDPEQLKLANYLNDQIQKTLGWELEILSKHSRNAICMGLSATIGSTNKEMYQLDVESAGIQISAANHAGLFYGIQTFMQLIHPVGEKEISDYPIAGVHIEDYPRFSWRGLMLDVSRHFFTVEEVKAYIDQMAKYKFNVFHWHLTDDQGWRVEIKALPELTDIGAWRVPRTGPWWTYEPPKPGEKATYGGYYTQEQIIEVVQYAADRYIQVLPEIDVPGHSLAMIAAYPNLSSTEKPYQVNPGSKFYTIEDNALNPAKEEVYEKLDLVFTEIAELFPFEYIHVGGDECYKGFWAKDKHCKDLMKQEGMEHVNELQSYFIKRMEKMFHSKGKKLIGWDEILEGGLAPEARVMSWRGMNGGIQAARMGHQVVMTPTTHCYLDLYQGDPQVEPITYSMLRLRDVYAFEPVPEGVDEKLILGGQGNLWTESVYTLGHAQYMTWPRSFALAEVLWSEKEDQDWSDFIARMEIHFERLDAEGINYAVSAFDPIIRREALGLGLEDKDEEGGRSGGAGEKIVMETEVAGLLIHYSFDDSFPDEHYPVYAGSVAVPEGATHLRVVTYRGGIQMGKQMRLEIEKIPLKK